MIKPRIHMRGYYKPVCEHDYILDLDGQVTCSKCLARQSADKTFDFESALNEVGE
jgi:hypothetical protein